MKKCGLLAGALILIAGGVSWAQTIQAAETTKGKIEVVAPGKFETVFTLRKGFGDKWFDLAHDADKKRDVAPVADENGFFWVKLAAEPNPGGGSWYANPAQKMELLESGPARVRVRLSGWHMRYGYTEEKAAMKNLGFELTHTVYPTGAVYTSYVLDAPEPVKLHHFLVIVKSTGYWGPAGKGEGKGEVHPASENGNDAKPGSKGPASWVLQWSDGPTYFTDLLMVFQKGAFGGTYWNEGYLDQDYRTGLNIMGLFPNNTVPQGKTNLAFMFRIADDMNGAEAAAPYAKDYRSPDTLAVSKGEVDKTDPGDLDADGYNECEGCYVLKAAADGVAFTLHGKGIPRMEPAFKVKGWTGEAPKTIKLGDKTLTEGKEFNASVRDGVLLLQVLSPVAEDVAVTITR